MNYKNLRFVKIDNLDNYKLYENAVTVIKNHDKYLNAHIFYCKFLFFLFYRL